ncbi:MAG: hypothetical protein AAF614_11345 [Chloroflexota bacterium]
MLARYLLLILSLTAVSCTTPAATNPPANKQGIHLLLDDGRHQWPTALWPSHMAAARNIVGPSGYVTQLVTLDDLDVAKWQQFMDLCAKHELIPIIRLATTFDQAANWWTSPPPDPDNPNRFLTTANRYATFLAALNWPTESKIIVVGNEPNHGNEWSGRPDPAAHARFLIDIAQTLHTADPAFFILNAGLDPYTPHTGSQPFFDGFYYMDAESFMDEMVAAEPDVFSHLNGWSSHPYPLGPFIAPPWEQTFQVDWLNNAHNPQHQPPPAGIYNRGVNGYEWELWKLAQLGAPELPVYITETGWRHSEDPYPTRDLMRTYIDLAWFGNENGRYPHYPRTGWTPWQEDARITAVTPFALNGHPREWHHTNWLPIDENGEIRRP